MKKLNVFINLIVLILITLVLNGCESKSSNTSSNQVQTTKTVVNNGPSESVIENEVIDLITTIPYYSYEYNTGMFFKENGAFKNLSVNSVKINSRKGVVKSTTEEEEELVNINVSGIADAYSVSMGRTTYQNRINFNVNKDFKFIKKNDRWYGYIYDRVRDKRNLQKVEPDYIRFRKIK